MSDVVVVTTSGDTVTVVSESFATVEVVTAGPQGPAGPAGTTDHLELLNIGTNTHASIDSHIASTANPHSVTKSQVGLGNVDNTSDSSKPISTATQTALNAKWDTSGNSGTTATSNFIGTTDAVDFVLRTNNTERVRLVATANAMGIGTGGSILANLHVIGTTGAGQFRLGYDGNKYLTTGVNSLGTVTWNNVTEGQSYIFQVNSATHFTLNSNGAYTQGVAPALGAYGDTCGTYLSAGGVNGSYEAGLYSNNGDETVAAFDSDTYTFYYMNRQLYGSGGSILTSAPVGIYSTAAQQLVAGYDFSNYMTVAVGTTGVTTFDAVGSGRSFVFLESTTIRPTSAASPGLTVQGIASQTENLLRIRDSSSQDLALFTSAGNLCIGVTSTTNKLEVQQTSVSGNSKSVTFTRNLNGGAIVNGSNYTNVATNTFMDGNYTSAPNSGMTGLFNYFQANISGSNTNNFNKVLYNQWKETGGSGSISNVYIADATFEVGGGSTAHANVNIYSTNISLYTSSGNLTNLYHYRTRVSVLGTYTGTFTNQYGLHFGSLTGATNNFGIFFSNAPSSGSIASAAATPLTFFAGSGLSGFGTTAPQHVIEAVGASGIAIDSGNNTGTSTLWFNHKPGTSTQKKVAILAPSNFSFGKSSGLYFAINALSDGSNAAITDSKLAILENGNVGVGNRYPFTNFSVSPIQYSTGTAVQSGTTITGTGTAFTSAMIGQLVVFNDGTISGPITAVASGTSMTSATSIAVSSQAFYVTYIGLNVTSAGLVGIGTRTPNANAALDVDSTTKAFMPPRMTTTQKNAIPSPTAGMVVYDSTLGKLSIRGASAWETVTSV